jgi:serine/threonine protein kinase
MSFAPSVHQVLDGYRLIRFLGRGGFGEVWLCRSEAMGDYRALKWIPATNPDRLEKEYDSLLHYRTAAARLRSPHLVAIEHVNRNEDGLYYVMPLADGLAGQDPADPAWQPLSLGTLVHTRASQPGWFSSEEIIGMIQPVLRALQTLSDAGLVHRDVKPENILFFNGHPCLGDISLLGADASVITRRGTPGYATPSWYAGGHPDMYGAAATLYSLLTGNAPDKMGRAAFLWPPQRESSLPEAERAEWKRLHGVIRRASDEKVAERFVDFTAMAEALRPDRDRSNPRPSAPRLKKTHQMLVVLAAGLAAIVASSLWDRSVAPVAPVTSGTSEPADTPATDTPIEASPLDESSLEDAGIAYNSLTWLSTYMDLMSPQESSLFQNALPQIQDCIYYTKPPDYRRAAHHLDQCIAAIPQMETVPNVMLARLLLLRSAGDEAEVRTKLNDPSFLVLGDDEVGYRVELLGRLDIDKAEEFLKSHLGSPPPTKFATSEALLARTRLRAKSGKFSEARADAEMVLALFEGDPVLRAGTEMKLSGIEDEFPAYAAYLKTLPEK